MRAFRAFRRAGLAISSLTVALTLWAVPGSAAIVQGDFNGDGVPDPVVVRQPSDGRIVVRLSGASPQVLRAGGRILSVVAADINHDGALDLTALSDRRGIHVWLNGDGHGRFTKATKRVRRHALVWSHASRAGQPQGTGDDRTVPQQDPRSSLDLADNSRLTSAAHVSCPVVPRSPLRRSSGSARACGSRAPPAASLN